MIKYFCDRCGKELVPGDRDAVHVKYEMATPKPLIRRTITYDRWLCGSCGEAFNTWITPMKENTDNETGDCRLQMEPKMED